MNVELRGSVHDNPQDSDARAIYLMDHPDSTEEIPVIDISGWRLGVPGARERIAEQLREATETIGFFYMAGHGVPQPVIDRVMTESRRFFGLPDEVKRRIPRKLTSGYTPLGQNIGNGRLLQGIRPNLFEAFTLNNRGPDDPDVMAQRPLMHSDIWPDDLPGFKEGLMEYYNAVKSLGLKFMDLWAASLDLPGNYFDEYFTNAKIPMRITHYPVQPEAEVGTRQYGLSPHTDHAVMTILAHGNVPGLAVRMPSGHWRAVEIKPDTFVVNTGDLMVRWTNGRYLSTKHRVINVGNTPRYSFPIFFTPNMASTMAVLPTCQGPDNPPKYPPAKIEDLCVAYARD